MADRTTRPDVPLESANEKDHRRALALRVNASLSKDGSNPMIAPLFLVHVVAADLSSPYKDGYDPSLWEGAIVYISDTGDLAVSDGTDWKTIASVVIP